jgi:hypothetical protein
LLSVTLEGGGGVGIEIPDGSVSTAPFGATSAGAEVESRVAVADWAKAVVDRDSKAKAANEGSERIGNERRAGRRNNRAAFRIRSLGGI